MKKLVVALLVSVGMISGCTTADLIEIDGSRYFKVLQVLDDGALAFRCDEAVGTSCYGMTVFIPSTVDSSMFDEKIIHMKNPTIVDRFTYTTTQKIQKTVPVMVDKP